MNEQDNFVEEFIELEVAKIWDAYLSIDVSAKTGNEVVSNELLHRLRKNTPYLALKDFFDINEEKDVYVTDDVISWCEAYDLYSIIRAIINKNVNVHMRVNLDKISAIEKTLEEVAKEEASKILVLVRWKYKDDGYALQLEKRCAENEHILRLYPNGKGVIVSIFDKDYKISYFKVPDNKQQKYNCMLDSKVRSILEAPQHVHEDDRYRGFPVVLWYGIIRVDTNAYNKINEWQYYEKQEFGYDEHEFKIIKAILSIPEVKTVWRSHLRLT